jgi:isopenicillin-N N-acyltransferase-like protein
MVPCRTVLCRVLVALVALSTISALGEETFRYREGKDGNGELKYINGLPVLVIEGTPEEMGRQQAALTREAAPRILEYPQRLLGLIGLKDRWAKFLERGRSLVPQIPGDHLAELDAFAETAGVDRDVLIGTNTMVDTYRGGFGCSSLIVEPERSATGGLLFGRNLDFYNLGILQKYGIVVVYRPENKHAFVSVGFPGMLGCFSGMNDAGLAVAVHEVFFSKDGGPMFNPKGMPYTLSFRRILEECATIEEAEKLMRSMPRTTLLNLAVCDRQKGAVLEMTPKNVVLRRSEQGICVCTNHFRTEPLATFALSRRYWLLTRSRKLESIGVAEVAGKLHQVNQGRLTVQTMIFEPGPLKLHLAMGSCPSSALPLRELELAELLKAGR